MLNVCHNCGVYRADKVIDPAGPFAVCPECGYKHPFRQLPLLMVSGASGAGKSTVFSQLIGKINGAVLLDADMLWGKDFDHPENNYRVYMELWLRMCKNISQAGQPVVLFGAGTGVPMNIEPCVERRYFSRIHYLALVCDGESLTNRLKARPAYRKSGDLRTIASQIEFNSWFKQESGKLNQHVELVDTTGTTVAQTAEDVAIWIRDTLKDTDIKHLAG